jgi:hypothetical protein
MTGLVEYLPIVKTYGKKRDSVIVYMVEILSSVSLLFLYDMELKMASSFQLKLCPCPLKEGGDQKEIDTDKRFYSNDSFFT